MASPPQTPTSQRRRISSTSIDIQTPISHRRRSSAAYSPTTPRSSHGHGFQEPIDQDSSLHEGLGGHAGASSNGLGSLADELADAEDNEYDEDIDEDDITSDRGIQSPISPNGSLDTHSTSRNRRDGGVNGIDHHTSNVSAMTIHTSQNDGASHLLSPDIASARSSLRGSRHRRVHSAYDGSDYGDSSDLEAYEGISPGLEAKMAAVESLARRGTEENGSASDGVVQRVIEGLKDLGGQAGVEGGATRYD